MLFCWKKYALCIFTIALPCAHLFSQEIRYRIEGSFSASKNIPEQVYLRFDTLFSSRLDSVPVQKGKFVLEGVLPEAALAYLSPSVSPGNGQQQPLFIGNGVTKFRYEGRFQKPRFAGKSAASDYHEVLGSTRSMLDSVKAIATHISETRNQLLTNEAMSTIQKMEYRRKKDFLAFIQARPGAEIVPYLLYELVNMAKRDPRLLSELKDVWPKLNTAVTNTSLARRTEKELNKIDTTELAASRNKTPEQLSPNFLIKGNTAYPAENLTLVYWNSNGQQTLEVPVIDGSYTLEGNIQSETLAMLKAGPQGAVPVPGGFMLISIAPDTFSIQHKRFFRDVRFVGSERNDALLELSKAEWKYCDEVALIRREIEKAEEHGNTELVVEKKQALDAKRKSLGEELYGRFMKDHPGSPALKHAFNGYAATTPFEAEKMEPYFALLPEDIRQSPSGQAFLNKINNSKIFDEVAGIGKTAPDFTQNDTAGNPVSLSAFRGKYVLLDFWASWCGPCREDNPNVVKAYQKYHDKGFDILGVSLDQPNARDKWLAAIKADGLTWTQVSDLKFWNNAAVKLYGVQGIPQNFLIDPDGKIIARSLRGEALDKKLGEIFEEE